MVSKVLDDLENAIELYRSSDAKVWGFLGNWSKRWHLDADWVRESGFWTLDAWSRTEERQRLLDKGDERRLYDLGGDAEALPPPEGFPSYFHIVMTEPDYLSVVRQTLREKTQAEPLLKYVDETAILEIAAKYCRDSKRKLKKPSAKREQIKELKRDIDWAVRYQVEEEEFRNIAKDDVASQDQIEKSVERMLRDLGLSPRNKPGRRKGSKSSYSLSR